MTTLRPMLTSRTQHLVRTSAPQLEMFFLQYDNDTKFITFTQKLTDGGHLVYRTKETEKKQK